MNRRNKKQILDAVRSLEKSNKVIEKCIVDINPQLNILLEQCQQVAIDIGTRLENEVKECSLIINLLERYCENLYQISIVDQSLKKSLARENGKIIIQVGNQIRVLVEEKIEIVFFPYKASMWDCMESVWQLVKDDPMFECHVVPIPYYEKDEQGNMTKEYYEIDCFPKEVSVEDYRQYKVDERLSDIAIIHNAYDDSNYVTSVHPDFYSSNLKQYIELLVYIPYFVSVDDVKSNYCTLPGVLLSDLVFVQSEEIRDTYIREYETFGKKYGIYEDLLPAKRKFIATGSPKYDKITYMDKDSINIPREWKKHIGNHEKPVVLYNIHLSGVMKLNADQFIKKLENTLEMFKKNRQVVLLWRPHPLILETARAMNPQICEKYEAIVKKYRDEDWGIYDDTPDMYTAITISDAYYGSKSSLVSIYQKTGKPIMLESKYVIYGEM